MRKRRQRLTLPVQPDVTAGRSVVDIRARGVTQSASRRSKRALMTGWVKVYIYSIGGGRQRFWHSPGLLIEVLGITDPASSGWIGRSGFRGR